jgi:hypothetical protein
MSWKTAKLIFYIGTLVSLLLFLGLTIDTHRQVASSFITVVDLLTLRPAAAGRRR